MSNLQAVVPDVNGSIVVKEVPKHTPGEGEILVKVRSVGVDPFAAKLQNYAFMPLPYPVDLGMGYTGNVEEVGPGVARFNKGDRVLVNRTDTLFNDGRTGANQRFAIAKEQMAGHIGPDADFAEAAAISTNLLTAAAALTVAGGLERPSELANPSNSATKVLVYGGSSQVGRLAIQYAQQAGYTVVTTSSPRNRGSVVVLDPLHVANHSAGADEVAAELVSHGPYAVVLDAVSLPATQAILGPIMVENKRRGGTNVLLLTEMPQTAPDGIEFQFNSYDQILQVEEGSKEMNKWFFEKFIPCVFDGTFKLAPTNVEKVPGGLRALQGMLDRILGVSGIKLVYDPWEE